MAITSPTPHKSRARSVIQAVTPSVRVVSQALLIACVLEATGELFYPNLPRHSLNLYLCKLGSIVFGSLVVRAAEWRKATG